MGDLELREQNVRLREENLSLREQLLEQQKRIDELESRVRELESQSAEALIFHNSACYEKDEQGQPAGAPYCPVCWEREGLRLHLIPSGPSSAYECQNCRAQVRVD